MTITVYGPIIGKKRGFGVESPSVNPAGDPFAAAADFRRRFRLRQTPAERMRAMRRLQETAWAALRRSPDGYAHFLRRNFKARAIRVSPDVR
jgi:hypothetical protein